MTAQLDLKALERIELQRAGDELRLLTADVAAVARAVVRTILPLADDKAA